MNEDNSLAGFYWRFTSDPGACTGRIATKAVWRGFTYLRRKAQSCQQLAPRLRCPSPRFRETSPMRTGRSAPALLLTEAERETLSPWTQKTPCPQDLTLRPRMILLRTAGRSNTEIAAELYITVRTLGKWRRRFIEQRLDGIVQDPRFSHAVGFTRRAPPFLLVRRPRPITS